MDRTRALAGHQQSKLEAQVIMAAIDWRQMQVALARVDNANTDAYFKTIHALNEAQLRLMGAIDNLIQFA